MEEQELDPDGFQFSVPLEGPSEPVIEQPDYNWQQDLTENTSVEDPPAYKPYPFALRPAPSEKIHIYFGVLVHQVNKMYFSTDGLVSQAGLSDPQVVIPSNLSALENRYKFYTLDWRGDVYLYWETDSEGIVTLCEIVGPDAPVSQGLPNDDGGRFHVKLGTVDAGAAGYEIASLEQNISSDVYWITAFGEQLESSSESGSSSSSASSASISDSGSDKSTAIVPMSWHDKGYGALFTMESNEVLFEFVMRDVPLEGAKTVARIDNRFLAVCEPDSMVITGVSGDRARSVGAVVEKNNVVLSAWPLPFLRPTKVTLKLTGVRKGFKHLDMPERSREQFIANEKFINSAYPAE